MDNEQAIKIIKDCKEKSFKRTLYTLNEYHEAIDMAIEALEQEPCDKCEVGNPCLYCKNKFEPQEQGGEELGEWLDHQNGIWIYAKCSKCESVHDVKSKYCPTCGAKMKMEGDDDLS